MPQAMRSKVPTSNFFTQLGYEHNPVARKNNTVAALLSATDAVMDRETAIAGRKGSGGGVLDLEIDFELHRTPHSLRGASRDEAIRMMRPVRDLVDSLRFARHDQARSQQAIGDSHDETDG